MRIVRKVRHWFYWLKCWLLHPYNVLTIKTLGPTWTDRDDVLVHAMFQILTDFVDGECPGEYIDTMHSHNSKEWQEIFTLYDWWKYAQTFDAMDDYWVKSKEEDFDAREYFHGVSVLEKDFNDDLTRNLKRLCELRGMLWT